MNLRKLQNVVVVNLSFEDEITFSTKLNVYFNNLYKNYISQPKTPKTIRAR